MLNIIKYKNKKGEVRYKFRIYIGIDPLTGKKLETSRSNIPSLSEAKILYADLLKGIEKPITKSKKIKEVLAEYLPIYKNTVKPSSYHRTLNLFKNQITPFLGEFYIEKVTIPMVQAWVNDRALVYVKYKETAGYLKKLFKFAISQGYCEKNPVEYITFPKMIEKKSKKIDVIWDVDQLHEFLDYVEKNKSKMWFTFFRLLAFSGMRRGEMVALEWSDIDLFNKTITVSKSRKKVIGGEATGDTKTSNVRVIAIDPVTAAVILDWKKYQFKALGPNKLVFCKSNGDYLGLTYPIKVLYSILDKMDLPPIDLHRFRHIHTTMLFQSNPHEGAIAAVMDRMGWTDIKTGLNIYNHVLPKAKKDLIENYLKYINE